MKNIIDIIEEIDARAEGIAQKNYIELMQLRLAYVQHLQNETFDVPENSISVDGMHKEHRLVCEDAICYYESKVDGVWSRDDSDSIKIKRYYFEKG